MEDIPIKERIKIFLWDLVIRPIVNFLKAKVKLSDLLLAIWIILIISFVLNHFGKLPIGIHFFSNILFNVIVLVVYLIISIIERWKSREFIGRYRKHKGILNAQQISKLAKSKNEKPISNNNQSLSEDKTPR